MALPIAGNGRNVQYVDYIDIEERAAATLAFSGTAAQTGRLAEGLYDVWATTDVYIKVDATDASTVTAANGYLIRSGNTVQVLVRAGSRIGAIGAGAATLSYHMVA